MQRPAGRPSLESEVKAAEERSKRRKRRTELEKLLNTYCIDESDAEPEEKEQVGAYEQTVTAAELDREDEAVDEAKQLPKGEKTKLNSFFQQTKEQLLKKNAEDKDRKDGSKGKISKKAKKDKKY